MYPFIRVRVKSRSNRAPMGQGCTQAQEPSQTAEPAPLGFAFTGSGRLPRARARAAGYGARLGAALLLFIGALF